MSNLSEEIKQQIEREAEHYANVQHSEKAKHIGHPQSRRWDDSKEDWEEGATEYASKWQAAEQRAERAEKALREFSGRLNDYCDKQTIRSGWLFNIVSEMQALTPKQASDER